MGGLRWIGVRVVRRRWDGAHLLILAEIRDSWPSRIRNRLKSLPSMKNPIDQPCLPAPRRINIANQFPGPQVVLIRRRGRACTGAPVCGLGPNTLCKLTMLTHAHRNFHRLLSSFWRLWLSENFSCVLAGPIDY